MRACVVQLREADIDLRIPAAQQPKTRFTDQPHSRRGKLPMKRVLPDPAGVGTAPN